MKNNNGLIIVTVILSVLVIILGVLLGGYIVNNSNNVVSKLDNTKEWVYDANYDLKTDKESYYVYDNTKLISKSDLIVPYINIDSDEAKEINQEIYKIYEDLIDKFNKNLKEEIWFTIVNYKTYIKNDILSVVITTESAGTSVPIFDYYTYNFDLKNGKLLSYKDVYKLLEFDEKSINNKANNAIENALSKEYTDGTNFEIYKNQSINNYKTSVNENTIKYFIDENQKLNIVVKLEMETQQGGSNYILIVD